VNTTPVHNSLSTFPPLSAPSSYPGKPATFAQPTGAALKDLAEADFRLSKAMQEWHNRTGDMLAYANDKLHPHWFDEIVKDDFAGLRQILEQRRPI
jgi:hypothetical protein